MILSWGFNYNHAYLEASNIRLICLAFGRCCCSNVTLKKCTCWWKGRITCKDMACVCMFVFIWCRSLNVCVAFCLDMVLNLFKHSKMIDTIAFCIS